jgi:hypothetical protein
MDARENIEAIMEYQGCTRAEATRLWYLSQEMAAEREAAPEEPSNVVLFKPSRRPR